jgi:hypothetical protein
MTPEAKTQYQRFDAKLSVSLAEALRQDRAQQLTLQEMLLSQARLQFARWLIARGKLTDYPQSQS